MFLRLKSNFHRWEMYWIEQTDEHVLVELTEMEDPELEASLGDNSATLSKN